MVWKTPCTLRLSTRSHEAVSCSASGAPQVAPALLTSTSTCRWSAATRLGQSPGPGLVGQIGGIPGALAVAGQLGDGGLDGLGLAGGDDHRGPGGHEPPGDHQPDAPGTPGHHHGLPGHGEQLGRGSGCGRVAHGRATVVQDSIVIGAGREGEASDASGTDRRTDRAQGRAALLLRPVWSTRSEGAGSDEPTYTRYVRRMGEDGWLGLGWPTEYGGQAPRAHRPDDLRRGVPLGRRAPPAAHPQQRGPDPDGARAPTSRSSASCPGSCAARSTSPSATPSRRPGPTWPRCRPGPCGTATST